MPFAGLLGQKTFSIGSADDALPAFMSTSSRAPQALELLYRIELPFGQSDRRDRDPSGPSQPSDTVTSPVWPPASARRRSISVVAHSGAGDGASARFGAGRDRPGRDRALGAAGRGLAREVALQLGDVLLQVALPFELAREIAGPGGGNGQRAAHQPARQPPGQPMPQADSIR